MACVEHDTEMKGRTDGFGQVVVPAAASLSARAPLAWVSLAMIMGLIGWRQRKTSSSPEDFQRSLG